MMTFSEKLVVLRKIKHLTQDEFASAVGVSRQAVYKWESGQSYPEVQKLLEMKMLFNISIDDLLDDTFEVELPKKKRRKRKSNPDAAATEKEEEKIVFIKPEVEAAPVVEEKKEPAAPAKVEKPAAPAKAKEEPAKIEKEAEPAPAPAAKAAPAPEAAPAPKAEPAAKVEPAAVEEKAQVAEEKAPEIKFSAEMPTVDAPAPKEINDPTQTFAKRGGLFSKIFGKK